MDLLAPRFFVYKDLKVKQTKHKIMKTKKSKISKGEQAILEMGLNVAVPINLNMLLTQSERDVLNIIRHRTCIKRPHISISLFSLLTGLSENTIRKARDSLLAMGIIEVDNKGISIGKEYKVKYDILMPMIIQLNEEKNPVKRLGLADKLRGKGREINKNLIERFHDSEFNN